MTNETLTEELERHAKLVMPNYPNDVCSRAKVAIERLTRELIEAQAAETRMRGYRDGLAKIGADLGQENERLRAQVKLLGEIGDVCVYDTLGVICDFCRCSRLTHEQKLDAK
jgi:hypothetical protein